MPFPLLSCLSHFCYCFEQFLFPFYIYKHRNYQKFSFLEVKSSRLPRRVAAHSPCGVVLLSALSFPHPRPPRSQSVETATTKIVLSQPTDDGIISHPVSELSQGPLVHSCSRFLYHRFRIEMLMDRDYGWYISSSDLTIGSLFSLVSIRLPVLAKQTSVDVNKKANLACAECICGGTYPSCCSILEQLGL